MHPVPVGKNPDDLFSLHEHRVGFETFFIDSGRGVSLHRREKVPDYARRHTLPPAVSGARDGLRRALSIQRELT